MQTTTQQSETKTHYSTPVLSPITKWQQKRPTTLYLLIACMKAHTQAHIHTHPYTYTHTHICTHMHTLIHTHTRTHTHTHTGKQPYTAHNRDHYTAVRNQNTLQHASALTNIKVASKSPHNTVSVCMHENTHTHKPQIYTHTQKQKNLHAHTHNLHAHEHQ